MKHIVSYQNPHQHFIDIHCIIENVNSEILDVHLPAWRPGRYELGNFAKNIQRWNVSDEKGKPLHSEKISKDHWRIETKNSKTIHINYNYYAAELNAGSTCIDDMQLSINPVNCLLYVTDKMNAEHILELEIPNDYKVATGLKKVQSQEFGVRRHNQKPETGNQKQIFTAKSFDELADSPLIASNSLKRNHFVYEGIEFNLWFQGECKIDWGKVIGDFFIFVNEQYEMFKEFPTREYHFLFQILPYKFHHGVEHLNSTVIALGPGYNLMGKPLYDEFLGVSSHELFHSWNIKSIRPAEMFPYDFSRENYSRLGYVAEGVTTYYGDLLLYRSGIYSDFDFAREFSESIQKHFDNFGRKYLSVAESSFDTWLDGYGKAIPNRVMSIYADGCLLAFMTDILIRKNSENKFSLDDVMRMLYYEFAKKKKGYTESDYKKLVETAAGKNFDEFFENYIGGMPHPQPLSTGEGSFETPLCECLDYIGCELVHNKSGKFYEAHWGIKEKAAVGSSSWQLNIYPGSVADETGLCVNDEIISVNGFEVKNDLAEWSNYFSFNPVKLLVKRQQQILEIDLKPSREIFYKNYFISKLESPNESQKENFSKWARRKF